MVVKRDINANRVDLSRAMSAAEAAQSLMERLHQTHYQTPWISFANVDGESSPRQIEHVLCKITADLRLAMAEVEVERLRRFGWPRPEERELKP